MKKIEIPKNFVDKIKMSSFPDCCLTCQSVIYDCEGLAYCKPSYKGKPKGEYDMPYFSVDTYSKCDSFKRNKDYE